MLIQKNGRPKGNKGGLKMEDKNKKISREAWELGLGAMWKELASLKSNAPKFPYLDACTSCSGSWIPAAERFQKHRCKTEALEETIQKFSNYEKFDEKISEEFAFEAMKEVDHHYPSMDDWCSAPMREIREYNLRF